MHTLLRRSYLLGIAFMAVSVAALLPSAHAQMISIGDSGFERPDLGNNAGNANSLQYFPAGTAWNFNAATGNAAATGGNGVTENGGFFNLVGATNLNSDGTTSTLGQAAFINGSLGISQSLTGFTVGSRYTVSFSLEARATDGANRDPISVFLGGMSLGTFTPTTTGSFMTFTTSAIVVSSATNTLLFSGTDNTGAYTSFVDNVAVMTAVPEPGTTVTTLLGGGLLLVLGLRRRFAGV